MQSLNHIYRTIWSDALGAWIAVSEITKTKGKRSASNVIRAVQIATASANSGGIKNRLKPILFAVAGCFALNAYGNPIGGTVTSGQATFATHGNTLTVTNTPGTIINWQNFSIYSNEVTNFAQQSAASTVLNRVTTANPSNILGTLQSNGRVFLVNPNGIVFGAGSTVNVGGLVASSLNLSDAAFKAGQNNFTGGKTSTGNVSNSGNINASNGGQIYLIAPNVENTGVITAPNGEIFLAAGNSVTLVNSQDPNLAVSITAPAGKATNIGQLVASAGSLGLFGTVVSNTGTASANGATLQGGKIVFKASQSASVGGIVSATGTSGGTIEVQGSAVHITAGAVLDASGANDGGTVLVGGGAHGADTAVMNAQTTTVDSGSTIKADGGVPSTNGGGLGWGNGGNISVWSDVATQAHGSISAQGGANGGNGGFIETSGHSLDVNGIQVNTSAFHGLTGTWLLDPFDFTIASTGGDITGSALSTLLQTNSITIQASTTGTNSATNLYANGPTGTAGDINVNDVVNWTANQLTLNAFNNININANLNGGGTAKLALLFGQGAVASGNPSVWNLNGGAQINLPAGQNFSTTYGSNGTAITYTVITSLGAAGSVTGTDLQGINGNLAGNYILGSNIDATATSTWNLVTGTTTYSGFTPIGISATAPFTGTFRGTNHVISNLYINLPTTNYVGLFGYTSSASMVRHTGLVGGSITGASYVGGLVGENTGLVLDSYFSGTVTGSGSSIGGLVGYNYGGTINGSHSTGSVNVTGTGSNIGGLAGNNVSKSVTSTSVTNSYSTSIVNATTTNNNVGGLIGSAKYGFITNSYATGDVTGASYVGGLVGLSKSTSINTFAEGNVTGTSNVGGLVGANENGTSASGAISYSYALGSVNGTSFVGGLVGWNQSTSSINNSFETGAVTGLTGSTNIGGLVGQNQGSINYAYSTGLVAGTSNAGSLVGFNTSATAVVNNVYALGTVNGLNVLTVYGTNLSGIFSNATVTFPTLLPITWSGSVSNQWTDPLSWVGGVVPTIFNTATFTGTTIVNIPSNVMIGNITTPGTNTTSINFTGANVSSLTVGFNGAGNATPVTLNATLNYGTSGKLNLVSAPSLTYNGNNYTVINALGATYQSFTNSDLQGINLSLTSNYVLGSDINASPTGNTSLWPASFTPIGIYSTTAPSSFTGKFDGLGHTINYLTVNQSLLTGAGLFADTSSASVIQNVGLVDGSVTGASYVGGLIGYNQGKIINTYFTGTVSGSSYIGGLVGENFTGGSISFSHSAGSVTGTSTGQSVGGLIGINWSSTVTNSYSTSNVTATSSTDVGGLIGGVNYGTVTNSYATGNVIGASEVGGLAGYSRSTITNTFATGSVTGTGSFDVGGLVGYGSVGTGGNTLLSYSYALGAVSGSSYVGGLVGRLGPASSISSSFATGLVNGTIKGIGGLVGKNIGTITGSYVSGISVTGSTDVGGLVGYNYGGTITSSSVLGSTATSGTVTGLLYVGGLVGENTFSSTTSGTITSSVASWINVSGTGTGVGNGTGYVGGLVGYNLGGTALTASISNSYVGGGSVSGSNYVGGLVGANANTTSASNLSQVSGSFSLASVHGSGQYIGGLVGDNNGSITNSYATGNSIGGTYVGGLAGGNGGSAAISNSYATGMTTGTTTGGLLGQFFGTVTNSFWDISTSGQGTSAAGTGLTTAAMMGSSNFTGWSFTATWGITTGSYPYFLWRYPTAPQVVSGTLSGTGNAGVNVQELQNGAVLGAAYTGADGFYYGLFNTGTIASGNNLLVLAGATPTAPATSLAVRLSDGNSLIGVDLTPLMLTVSSNSTAAVSNANLVAAAGTLSLPYSVSANNITDTLGFQTAAGTNYNLNGNITSTGSQIWNGPVTISTAGAYNLIATGATSDVTVNGGINYTGTSTAGSLAIVAGRNIIVQTAPIQATGTQALNVSLDSDYSSTTGGAVGLFFGGNILSNGGNITIGGGTGTISAGVGFAQGYNGVFPDGSASGNGVDIRANLTAAGGNIIINGNADTSGSAFNPIGVSIGGTVSTTGTGAITLTGQSLSPTNSPYGVEIGNAGTGETTLNGSVTTVNGNILVNGTAGTTTQHGNIGLMLINSSTIQATGSGNITLNGAATAPITLGGGIDIQSFSGNPSVLANSGNILITTSTGSGMSLSNTAVTSTSGNVTLDSINGAIGITDAQVISGGNMAITLGGNLSLVANTTSAILQAGGTQTINFTGSGVAQLMTVQGGNNSAYSNAYASVDSTGLQTISYSTTGGSTLGMVVTGGSAVNNANTAFQGLGGVQNVVCTACFTGNVADIQSSGGQTITASTITVNGGAGASNAVAGNGNAANIQNASTTVAQNITTTGAISLTGGTAPGYFNPTYPNNSVTNEANIHSAGVQTISAGSISLNGGGDANTLGGAFLTGAGGQTITTLGNVAMTGGLSNAVGQYGLGAPAVIGEQLGTTINLTAGGSIAMTGGSGTSSPALIGAASGTPLVNITATDFSMTAGAGSASNMGLVFGGAVGSVSITATAGAITQDAKSGIEITSLITNSTAGTTLNGLNLVGSFTASNTGTGNISLTNTNTPLTIIGLSSNSGNAVIDNTGGVIVAGVIITLGSFDLTAHSPITINSGASINAGGAVSLIAGSPGSTSPLDIISILGAITGSRVSLAAHQVSGNIPAGALINVASSAPAPAVLDTLASVAALLPTTYVNVMPVGNIVLASANDVVVLSGDEKNAESSKLASEVSKSGGKQENLGTAKPLPVCN